MSLTVDADVKQTHRAVQQARQRATLAVDADVTQYPYHRCAAIGGEDHVLCSVAVEPTRYAFAMMAGRSICQFRSTLV